MAICAFWFIFPISVNYTACYNTPKKGWTKENPHHDTMLLVLQIQWLKLNIRILNHHRMSHIYLLYYCAKAVEFPVLYCIVFSMSIDTSDSNGFDFLLHAASNSLPQYHSNRGKKNIRRRKAIRASLKCEFSGWKMICLEKISTSHMNEWVQTYKRYQTDVVHCILISISFIFHFGLLVDLIIGIRIQFDSY